MTEEDAASGKRGDASMRGDAEIFVGDFPVSSSSK
jgi:hypothetical protein